MYLSEAKVRASAGSIRSIKRRQCQNKHRRHAKHDERHDERQALVNPQQRAGNHRRRYPSQPAERTGSARARGAQARAERHRRVRVNGCVGYGNQQRDRAGGEHDGRARVSEDEEEEGQRDEHCCKRHLGGGREDEEAMR